MRILSTESLVDTIVRYSEEPNSLGLVVLRNGERRRDLYRELNSIIFSEEVKPIRHGCVLSFRNHSMIHILIAANRPTRLYDDVLVDETIDDMELLYHLDRAEFNSYQPGYTLDFDPADYEVVWENGTLKIVKKEKNAPDFGELSPSQELNDFVDTLVLGK